MSFESVETSLAEGRPLRLYRFTLGGLSWYYSSGDRDIAHQGNTYRPLIGGIIDDGIRQTGQDTPDQITLTAPADIDVAQLYRGHPPASEVVLTIFNRHTGLDDYLLAWSGNVRNVKWEGIDRCEIMCAPVSERMTTTGLRLSWGRACPHALYSRACGVSAAIWRVAGLVQAVDGTAITVPAAAAYPDGYFTAGYVEWAMAGGAYYERRGIAVHAGASLSLIGGTLGIPAGTAANLYPGCRQTALGCKAFGNYDNFGGIPNLPGVSPFDGRNIF